MHCAASPTGGPIPTWAIEGASGLGAPLTARLRTDGVEVIDVPAKLAARVRVLSTGHGRKNDEADAVRVGIAALTAPGSTPPRSMHSHRDTRHRRTPRGPGENPNPDRQSPPRGAHQSHTSRSPT